MPKFKDGVSEVLTDTGWLVQLLKEVTESGESGITIDGIEYTPEQLVSEIEQGTSVGVRFIRYHHRLSRILREK